jgi:hypothetical protein
MCFQTMVDEDDGMIVRLTGKHTLKALIKITSTNLFITCTR